MPVGRAPQVGQGIGQPDFVWLRGLAGGNNQFTQDVVAFAGGGQASATPMGVPNAQGTEAVLIRIKTVTSVADSCQLPQAGAGKTLLVFNSSANSANVYANPSVNKATSVTDTVNGSSNVTAYALAGGKSALFFCPVDGIWAALLSA